MKIMHRTLIHALLGLSIACVLTPASVAAEKQHTNFLFLLVDDLGWKDLSCYGSEFYESPNIDALAKSGMRFTDAYAACPVCSPTRAAIMTGKYPPRVNITDWIPGQNPKNRKLKTPADASELALSEVTIAEALKDAGYATFFAGKWHLGSNGFFPEEQGFDHNLGGHHRGSPPGGYYAPYKNPKLKDGPKGEYLTDRLTDETIQFIEANRDKPFLAYLSFYTVHTPIQACQRHLEKFKKKAAELPKQEGPAVKPERQGWTRQRQDNPAYASMVYALDENVGRLMDKLDELKLADNTVVIFTSDNGGLSTLFRKGAPTSELPLRAGKGWCYEGGIRVPLIIRAPGVTTPGSECGEPVTSTDYFPTMLALAGLKLQPQLHRDGVNLLPLLQAEASLDRRAIFWHYPHYHGSAWTPGAAVRAGKWKLIEFYEYDTVELYNLEDDIGERNDLAARLPEQRDELLRRLRTWQKEVGARLPRPSKN